MSETDIEEEIEEERAADESEETAVIPADSSGNLFEFSSRRYDKKLARLAAAQSLDSQNAKTRESLSDALKDSIDTLKSIAKSGTNKDKLKAIEIMARFGPGEPGQVSTEAVRARVVQTVEVIRNSLDILTSTEADTLIERIRQVWMQ